MSHILYQATGVPAMQNKLYESQSQARAAPIADLLLAQDDTGVVSNQRFNSSLVVYDEGYQNEQGHSSIFQKHLLEVYRLCRSWLKDEGSLVVEIGCGKGGFVELLRGKGLNIVGYDMSYEGQSPYIRKCFFGTKSHEKGDLLILRHVLEHIESPWRFLEDIAEANSYHGLLYIEVPDLYWILGNNAFFDLFHEHVNYFTADDFRRRFGPGLVWHGKSFGGQYLSLLINLEAFRREAPPTCAAANSTILQANFLRLVDYEAKTYDALLKCARMVIWGAGAKGVMFACKAPQAVRSKINYAIDISPGKQGMYMPASGIPVLDPASGLDKLDTCTTVVIMNPNYESEIRKLLPRIQPITILH